MRQTPFGVWNPFALVVRRVEPHAPMRQTPFGVWNLVNLRKSPRPTALQ